MASYNVIEPYRNSNNNLNIKHMEPKTITVKEVIENTLKELKANEIPDRDREVLSNVRTYMDILRGTGPNSKDFREYTPQELSRIAGNLALLKENLADMIARAGKNMRIMESMIKLRKGNLRVSIPELLKTKGIKATVDNVKAEIDRQIFKQRIKRDFLEEHYEKSLYIWRSVNSVLDVVSQRVNVLHSQKADVGYIEDSLEIIPDGSDVQATGEIKS